MDENRSNSTIATSIVIFFDLIVSIIIGIKFVPASIHILIRIAIIFAIIFGSFFIMNIRKFGIGFIAIVSVSLLFTWVINGLILAPYVDDTLWKWILRACAFFICLLGHIKLTIWDNMLKNLSEN